MYHFNNSFYLLNQNHSKHSGLLNYTINNRKFNIIYEYNFVLFWRFWQGVSNPQNTVLPLNIPLHDNVRLHPDHHAQYMHFKCDEHTKLMKNLRRRIDVGDKR